MSVIRVFKDHRHEKKLTHIEDGMLLILLLNPASVSISWDILRMASKQAFTAVKTKKLLIVLNSLKQATKLRLLHFRLVKVLVPMDLFSKHTGLISQFFMQQVFITCRQVLRSHLFSVSMIPFIMERQIFVCSICVSKEVDSTHF